MVSSQWGKKKTGNRLILEPNLWAIFPQIVLGSASRVRFSPSAPIYDDGHAGAGG
jgi:hypothetical protein